MRTVSGDVGAVMLPCRLVPSSAPEPARPDGRATGLGGRLLFARPMLNWLRNCRSCLNYRLILLTLTVDISANKKTVREVGIID